MNNRGYSNAKDIKDVLMSKYFIFYMQDAYKSSWRREKNNNNNNKIAFFKKILQNLNKLDKRVTLNFIFQL